MAVVNETAPQPGERTSKLSGLTSGAIWSVIVAAVLMTLSAQSLLPEAPDKITYNWRTAILSDRAKEQRSDIAVVLINEDSLAKYWYRSPVDRALLAELVRAVDAAKPKAIGLDFIFDRAAEPAKQRALMLAIRDAKSPIILGAIDKRASSVKPSALKWQEDFLAKLGRPAGHLFFQRQPTRFSIGDDVVRFMLQPSETNPGRQSFAMMLADIDGKKFEPKSPYIDWILPPQERGTELFPTLRVPPHEPVDGLGNGERILPADLRELLTGKIVLIGGDFVDRDKHLTPLSVLDDAAIPGVLVHAQILAQLLDGRSIETVPVWAEFAALVLLGTFGFYLGYRFKLKRFDFFVSLAGVVGLIALGAMAFSYAKLIIPSTTLFTAWIVGVTSGHFYHWAKRVLGLSN